MRVSDDGPTPNRKRAPSVKKQVYFCQVDGCSTRLSNCKAYCVRYRVCQQHLAAASVLIDGVESRFCQQCGRFQELTEFDGTKRSCRTRLAHHNNIRQQRRKEAATAQLLASSLLDLPRNSRPSAARQPGTFGSMFDSPTNSPDHCPPYAEYSAPRHDSNPAAPTPPKQRQDNSSRGPSGSAWLPAASAGAVGAPQAAGRAPSSGHNLGSSRWTEATAAEFFMSKANKRPWSEQEQQRTGVREQQEQQRCHQQRPAHAQQQATQQQQLQHYLPRQQPAHYHAHHQHQQQQPALYHHWHQQQAQADAQQQAPAAAGLMSASTALLQPPAAADSGYPPAGWYGAEQTAAGPVMGLLQGAPSQQQDVLHSLAVNPLGGPAYASQGLQSGDMGISTPLTSSVAVPAAAATAACVAGIANNSDSNNSSPSTASEQGQVQLQLWPQPQGRGALPPDTALHVPAHSAAEGSRAAPDAALFRGSSSSLQLDGGAAGTPLRVHLLAGRVASSSSYQPTQAGPMGDAPAPAAAVLAGQGFHGGGDSSAPNRLRCDSTGSWVGQHHVPSLPLAAVQQQQHSSGSSHHMVQVPLHHMPWVGAPLAQEGTTRAGLTAGIQVFSPRVPSAVPAGAAGSRVQPAGTGAAGPQRPDMEPALVAPNAPATDCSGGTMHPPLPQQAMPREPAGTAFEYDPMLTTPRPATDKRPGACGTGPASGSAGISPFAGASGGDGLRADVRGIGAHAALLQDPVQPMRQGLGHPAAGAPQEPQGRTLAPAHSNPSCLLPTEDPARASNTQGVGPPLPRHLTRHLSLLSGQNRLGSGDFTGPAQAVLTVAQGPNAAAAVSEGTDGGADRVLLSTWSSTSSLERILSAPVLQDWPADAAAAAACGAGGPSTTHEELAGACLLAAQEGPAGTSSTHNPSTAGLAPAGLAAAGGSGSGLAQQGWPSTSVSNGQEGPARGCAASTHSSEGDATAPACTEGRARLAEEPQPKLQGNLTLEQRVQPDGSAGHTVPDWQAPRTSMGAGQHVAGLAGGPGSSNQQALPPAQTTAAAPVGADRAPQATADAWAGFADCLLGSSTDTEGHVADLMQWAAGGADIMDILADKGM